VQVTWKEILVLHDLTGFPQELAELQEPAPPYLPGAEGMVEGPLLPDLYVAMAAGRECYHLGLPERQNDLGQHAI